ncbi:hypothetical protein CEXT_599241 [Caerostris extrusa]|uniref:Uncharacterized protein n=1 Tax=Caerostris extrusa TaxID=172846 RepID=A0AAV4S941_CAEEX|nr:hypothetical protein CEXT_599241 [Caerostris extrusa]
MFGKFVLLVHTPERPLGYNGVIDLQTQEMIFYGDVFEEDYKLTLERLLERKQDLLDVTKDHLDGFLSEI